MSTVKVVNVQHPSASTAAVTLAADGSMTGAFPAPNRNLLYNGAMQLSQRGTSASGLTSFGYATADRWLYAMDSFGTWTQSVENDAPTGSGLRKSLKMLCTTAQASPASDKYLFFDQRLEGQDLQRIAKGTASAQQLTLSFWVKSNKTGTYIAELMDEDNNRYVSASYSVSASATWEKKTITFPADTTGALDNDNAGSLYLRLWLGAGSNFTSGTLATSWGTPVTANRAVGQTNLAAATNNYWQITGVQLEVGPVATGFEFKSYGQELRECQRYYQKATSAALYGLIGHGIATSATAGWGAVPLVTRMRTVAAYDSHSNVRVYDGVNAYAVTALSDNHSSATQGGVNITVASGMTAARPLLLESNNDANGFVAFTAEL